MPGQRPRCSPFRVWQFLAGYRSRGGVGDGVQLFRCCTTFLADAGLFGFELVAVESVVVEQLQQLASFTVELSQELLLGLCLVLVGSHRLVKTAVE